jgi:hypothetical protein
MVNANGFPTLFSCSGASEDHPDGLTEGFYLILKADLPLARLIVDACYSAAAHKQESGKANPVSVLLYFCDTEPMLKLTVSDFVSPVEAERSVKAILQAVLESR